LTTRLQAAVLAQSPRSTLIEPALSEAAAEIALVEAALTEPTLAAVVEAILTALKEAVLAALNETTLQTLVLVS